MAHRPPQPQASGSIPRRGSAWVSARTSEREVALQAFASDPKYRKYTQQVEKCLNSFDNVHEWADCIAFLKQLLKTFQSYMQFKEIPRKLVVAKRLAQCLNPALPTGVHQRALDVYTHILGVQGTEGLKKDLSLWSSGLFPFFEYAATSVKPTLLTLYDTHYLPLQASLRPIMKSFIIALLPGLEEETGEFFDKVLTLLDRLSETVSQSFFLQNVWLVMLTTPSARGTALNLLSRRLPALHSDEDIASIVGGDVGLMIRAFSAALEDDNLLVRRGALDILLQSVRVDSAAVKRAQKEDQTILMRAATGVVLRRDLSLNRRLYTWLLGPEEKSEAQMAYFRENSLSLLDETLREEMFEPSKDYSQSRPFKIFISLLDKWEIGAPLTHVLVYDAFKAIKLLADSGLEGEEEMMMTAGTLYEAVEPQIIWKHLLSAIFDEIATGDGERSEAIRMATFILRSFSVQDEEIQVIHLPVVFVAIAEFLTARLQRDHAAACSTVTRETLLLLEELLMRIPHASLLHRPDLTAELQASTSAQGPYAFACTFYCIQPLTDFPPPTRTIGVPFASAFESLIDLSTTFAQQLQNVKAEKQTGLKLGEVLAQALLLLDHLVSRVNTSIAASWKPKEWLSLVLDVLERETANFTLVDRTIALAVVLHGTLGLEPRLWIDDRLVMSKMVNNLLKYLRSERAVYHLRAVNLIWALEGATERPHVESIIAQSLTSPERGNVQEAFEAFGVFWRLTEDNMLPGFRFKVPIMIVLDTLKSDDPDLRRIGETWMRCSLKSYVRVLDPIVFDLLDPLIRRTSMAVQVKDKELQGFLYERPFDQRYVNHLLDIVVSIASFGAQGFARTMRTVAIRRSQHAGLIQRVESIGVVDPNASYLDVLVEILLRFLQSEPRPTGVASMQRLNQIIHSTSIDLLQALVSRGEVDTLTVEIVEATVIQKLYFCVHAARLDVQNKLLHLLHSLISATASNRASTTTGNRRSGDRASQESTIEGPSQEKGNKLFSANALLVQTVVDGLATPTNRPVLQHWLDFILILTTIPQFLPTLQAVVGPINDCLCRQLRAGLADVMQASRDDHEDITDVIATTTDAELIMLLHGLERFTLLSLASMSDPNPQEDEGITEKAGLDNSSGLLGYVSGVFGSDNVSSSDEEQLTARSPGYRALHEGVRVLYAIWVTLAWSKGPSWSSKDDSLSMIYNRTRARCRRVLENLFRVHPAEVLESIVDCWSHEQLEPKAPEGAAFELVDVLIATASTTVHMLCESVTCRIAGLSERIKKQAINPNLSDSVLLQFLEQYLRRLEGPLALQVWGRFFQLAREVTGGSSREFRVQSFPVLRCLSVLAEKLVQTTAMEDRRIRKDLQETFGKLLDGCIVYVGRSSDQGSWIRRVAPVATNGRDSPVPRTDPKIKFAEKTNSSSISLPDILKPAPEPELTVQIIQFIAATALPNLRRFLMDNDKVTAMCSNIFYYIITPSMKGRTKPLDVDDAIVDCIREVTKNPYALKAWRTPVADLLNDNRFFNSNPQTARKWKGIMKLLFDVDKTAFPELLAKVATAPSANIFTNREYEMLLRSLNLRRLSYIIFTGEKNHFLAQLPVIQEKLVDIFKNVASPVVQSEAYLCIRILLCRLSPHNLTSFWPVLLTELYQLFERVMMTLPADSSEELQLVLSASKCLDLLLVLQTEEFQIHQWIFITDTVDAVYRPDDYFPQAMMDELAEIAGNLPVAESRDMPTADSRVQLPPSTLGTAMSSEVLSIRRPMLGGLHQIDSIRDLVPFFSNVSITNYECVYASRGTVDWEAVEAGLMDDMFDGL